MLMFSRPLLLSASLVARRPPLFAAVPRAALSMSSSALELAAFTKTFWADVAAAGQSKDADKVSLSAHVCDADYVSLGSRLEVPACAESIPAHTPQINTVCNKYYTPDCNLIRPSGNPLDLAGFKGMLGSPDIVVETDDVISVDDVKVFAGGDAAVVVYTTLSKFTYQGTPNDDIAKFSATLAKTEDGWKVVHLHRGTGQKPQASSDSQGEVVPLPPPFKNIGQ